MKKVFIIAIVVILLRIITAITVSASDSDIRDITITSASSADLT